MIGKKEIVLGMLVILLFVVPVLATDDPGIVWTKDMYGAVSDIDFDTLVNNIVVSDKSGNITCYSNDGNTTKWTKDTESTYVKELLLSVDGSKIGYRTSATDGNMTYLDGTLGTTLWTPAYTAGWGTAVDIDMPTDASKLLTTFASRGKLYNAGETDIGNITPPTGTWNNGVISQDNKNYMVMSRATNATLYLYKYGYGTTWSDATHENLYMSSYDYRRILTLTGVTAAGTLVSFAITTNPALATSTIFYLHGETVVALTDNEANAISSTRTYNAVTGYYDIYFDPDGESTIWIFYG